MQRFSSPRLQNRQAPHVLASHAMPILSPTENRIAPGPQAVDDPDDLVARDHVGAVYGQVTLRHVQVGPTHPAHRHPHQYLSGAGLGKGPVHEPQRALVDRGGARHLRRALPALSRRPAHREPAGTSENGSRASGLVPTQYLPDLSGYLDVLARGDDQRADTALGRADVRDRTVPRCCAVRRAGSRGTRAPEPHRRVSRGNSHRPLR